MSTSRAYMKFAQRAVRKAMRTRLEGKRRRNRGPYPLNNRAHPVHYTANLLDRIAALRSLAQEVWIDHGDKHPRLRADLRMMLAVLHDRKPFPLP